MKFQRIFLTALFSAILLWSCSVTNKYRGIPIEVTVIQMNDVYEISPLQGGQVGGMARVAHVIQEEKAKNPNTIALLAGDFLSPSLLGTLKHNGERIKGKQMVEVLNVAGLDLVTFGNHEFDLDRDELQERIYLSEFDYVSSNVFQQLGNRRVRFQEMENGKIIDIPTHRILRFTDTFGREVEVGVFGVTLPFTQKEYVDYDPVESTVNAMVDSLEGTHAQVAITHLAITDDTMLARKFPSIDLITGGHDHENMYHRVNGVPVAKADANAKTIYIHRMRIFIDGRVEVDSELKAITDEIPEDPETKKVVEKWNEVQEEVFENMGIDPHEKLMTAPPEGLEGREAVIRNQPTNLGKLIANALLYASDDADASILNSGSVRVDDVLKGDISQYDVMRTLPFGGSVLVVEMKGLLLEKVLNIGRKNKGTGGFLQWADITVDSRRNVWMVDGDPIKPNQVYRIAMPEFLMTGMESNMSFLTVENDQVINVRKADEGSLREDIRYAVIEYMKEKK